MGIKSISLATAALTLISSTVSASVVYSYTGSNFTEFYEQTSGSGVLYNGSDSITGQIQLAELLVGSSNSQVMDVEDFSFSDGVNTYTKANGAGILWSVTYNGDISALKWSLSVQAAPMEGVVVGGTQYAGITSYGGGISVQDTASTTICIGVTSNGGCEQETSQGYAYTAGTWALTGDTTIVPVPAAVWLFGSGLLGLFGVARRKARA